MTRVRISKLPPARWREARALRLDALKDEPAAFASSYEDELAFSDDLWIGRLESAYARAGNMTLFADADAALVGMAGANWSAKAKLRHVAEIYGVYVAPGQRSKGIATALMRPLLDELRAIGHIEKVKLEVNSEARAAIRLYEKLGFKRVGTARRELKVDGRYFDLQCMELHFRPRARADRG